MSRRPATFVLLALALVFAGPAAAEAGKSKPAKTTIDFYTVTSSSENVFVLGEIGSKDKHCVAGRQVKVELVPTGGGGNVNVDTARAGMNGGWLAMHSIAGIIENGPYAEVVATVKQTNACKGATAHYPLDD